jgi:imidazolonepropionase-like amidohydrolase
VYTTWNDEALGSVRVISPDGTGDREVVSDPGLYVEPRFSVDGDAIAYRKLEGGYILSGIGGMNPGLYIVRTAGGEPKLLTHSGTAPQFSAAARDRVFFTDGGDDNDTLLKSVDLLGHDERTHLKDAEANEFSLSPDGKWIAFTEQWNAYVAPFALTGRAVEIGSKSKNVPVKQVSKRAGENLTWSSDSLRLNWSHGPNLYTRALSDAFSFLKGAPDKLPEPVETGTRIKMTVETDHPSGRIALVGARIVTMRNAGKEQEVIEDGVLVTNGNRIESIGRRGQVAVPADAKVFEVKGKTIIPGLVDVHAHGPDSESEITPQQNWTQYVDLSFGVTTIHDPSNDSSSIFSAAELQRAGLIVSPRIYSTGTILYGANAPGFRSIIDSLDDALYHVRRQQEMGAISVKSYQQPRRDQRQQIIEAARQLGMMVVPEGGAKFQHNMTEIVDGHTGIEHAIPIVKGYDDLVQMWSQSKTGYTPTFVVAYGGLSGENYWYQHSDVWKDERLTRYTPRFVIEPRSMRRTMAPDEHYNHVYVARFADTLRERGVNIQIGAHGQLHGLAAHWEIWSLTQGGFTPWQALRAATIDGAHYLGLDGQIGSLETGKLADLAVIDGNPLDDIRRSEYVTYTMQNGRLYDTATMNQLAPEAKARQPFFFEREGGDTIHPAVYESFERERAGD